MINKIKDFLKNKLKRRASDDLSDQDELLEDDKTGDHQIPMDDDSESYATKPKLKDRLTTSFNLLKNKLPAKKLTAFPLKKKGAAKNNKTSSLLSPSLTQSIEKFLSRESRESIHQMSLALLICTATYTLGKLTALTLRGTPTLDSAKDYSVSIPLDHDFNPALLGQVRNINIFRTNTGPSKKKVLADTKCEEAQKASSLPIKLVNTVVLQDAVKSIASVQVRGDRSLVEVREGEQISNLAKISKITRLEILVKNLESGICESIASDKMRAGPSPISVMSPSQSRDFKRNKKLPGIENKGNKFIISKALLNEKMKDIANIVTQVRAIRIQNPDGSLSFKLTEMDPEGIFPYLGLQDQDTITSINGKPIYDINEIMALFGRIKNLDQLQLGIKREGTDSQQEYSIKK